MQLKVTWFVALACLGTSAFAACSSTGDDPQGEGGKPPVLPPDAGTTGTGQDPDAGPQPDFWMPGPGQITNVNQNSASDVDIEKGVAAPGHWYNGFYGANSFGGMTYSWNGAVWAPGYSADGALAFFGGGHGANIGCFSYFFDITSRMWKQVGAERNLPEVDDWSGGHPYDAAKDKRDPTWLDYDYNGSKLIILGHQYAAVNYLSPAEGGAAGVGSLLAPNAETDQTAGHAARWGSWAFSLKDGQMTRTRADAPTDGVGSGQLFSIKDTVNKKIWYFKHGQSVAHYLDLIEPNPRPLHDIGVAVEPGAPNDGYMVVYDVTWLFVPEAKAALAFLGGVKVNSGMAVVMADLASGSPVMAAVNIPSHPGGETGFAHGAPNVAAAWDSKRHRIVLYEGMGDSFTHVLTPSSVDFRTATWTWSRESYTGKPPANGLGVVGEATSLQSPWGRFRYVPTLDVFLWTDGPPTEGVGEDGVTRNGIVQFWHPEGTPF